MAGAHRRARRHPREPARAAGGARGNRPGLRSTRSWSPATSSAARSSARRSTLLAARREPTRWVRGNCEREAVAIYDGAPVSEDSAGRAAEWSARALDRPLARRARRVAGQPRARQRVLLPRLPAPRRRDHHPAHPRPGAARDARGGRGAGWSSADTPISRWSATCAAVVTYANAGSVGMPYEGRAGSVLDDRRRRRARAAGDELRPRRSGRGAPRVRLSRRREQLVGSLLDPTDPDWVTAFFEHGAGRGEHPGEPPATAPDTPATTSGHVAGSARGRPGHVAARCEAPCPR